MSGPRSWWFIMHSHSVVLFSAGDKYPGMVFFDEAKQEVITSEGRKLDYEEEMGVSLLVPEKCLKDDEQLDVVIQVSFSGTYAGPEELEPVSPAYLVRTTGEGVQLQKDLTLRIQHIACLEEEEDSKGLVVLKASSAPSYRGPIFGPIYVFHEMKGSEVKFDGQFGEVRTRDFSWFMIWRKKKANGRT